MQIHNLTRDFLPYEAEACVAVMNGITYQRFAVFGDSQPVSRKLSLMVRPALIARPGKVFVWSDWSNIEARILPWLAGDDDPGAQVRLNIFRQVDADPSVPDLYTRTAAKLSHVRVEDVTKAMRQRGKVAELALGFGGGLGALQAMGAGYGIHVSDEEGRTTVAQWRADNQWCVKFWGAHQMGERTGLWGAALNALDYPRTLQRAGRIQFIYMPEFGKSLLMVLPSGRLLTYRDIRFEHVADLDDDDNVVGYSTKLRFHKGYYRSVIWHGTFAENAVQATAADILRGTLVRLDEIEMGATAHTHDEVLVEVDEDEADGTEIVLASIMRQGFDWSKGLPIMSEEETGYYYSKWENK